MDLLALIVPLLGVLLIMAGNEEGFSSSTSWMELVGRLVTYTCAFWLLNFLYRRLWRERHLQPIQNKVIVITGCDSGFGRMTAVRLVEEGATVIAGVFLEESLTSLKEEVGSLADKMHTLRLNLEDDDSTDRFVLGVRQYLHENNLSLHGFVNNAGRFAASPSEWISRETMRRMFNVNTIGAMELSNRMAPLLHQTGGRMVSISSVSALVHGPQLSLYGATKAALDNFQSSMRAETDRKFSVHLILPGGFRTPLLNPEVLRANITQTWNAAPADVRHDYGTNYFTTFMNNWSTGVVKFANDNPGWVVDNVVHALFAEHPRDRYYTGGDAIFLFGPLSFAPTCIQDFVMSRANARFFRSPNGRVRMAASAPQFMPMQFNPAHPYAG